MGLPTDDYLSRAGHAEGAELLTMWLSPMNACSCAMPYVSHRGRSGRGVAHYVVITDECLLMRNALYLAQGTQRARRPVGASFVGVSLHGTLSLRRGVIRRGVIAWHPVSVSVGASLHGAPVISPCINCICRGI